MKKLTLQERVVRYLVEGVGMKEAPSRSRKYRKFIFTDLERAYWVGRKGAVRVGKTVSNSISLTDRIIPLIKKWEEKNGK